MLVCCAALGCGVAVAASGQRTLRDIMLTEGESHPLLHTYDDHQIVRINASSPDANNTAVELEISRLTALADELGLDVWKNTYTMLDVRVSPSQKTQFLPSVPSFGPLAVTVLQQDLGETVRDNFRPSALHTASANASKKSDFFADFHDLDELIGYWQELAKTHSDLVKYVPSIGRTHEGRDIPAVHIKGTRYSGTGKYFFEGQIHSREWVSGVTVAYLANQLVEGYSMDANKVTKKSTNAILDSVEFVIVPVANPDGFAYTWSNDRMWRKNRAINRGSSCVGVDLNRNWDASWSGPGASNNPCSDTYYGTAAFSEAESKSVSEYVKANGPFLVGIDFHSYSQIVMRPYGYTKANPAGVSELQAAAKGMADAIQAKSGLVYTPEPAAQLYVASGGADDWMFDKGGCAKAFTFELRDTGRYGFTLPANQIKPNGEEIWSALQWLLNSKY